MGDAIFLQFFFFFKVWLTLGFVLILVFHALCDFASFPDLSKLVEMVIELKWNKTPKS